MRSTRPLQRSTFRRTALQDAEAPPSLHLVSSDRSGLNDRLRRTQAMIEEARTLMNRDLAEWIEGQE